MDLNVIISEVAPWHQSQRHPLVLIILELILNKEPHLKPNVHRVSDALVWWASAWSGGLVTGLVD